MDPEEDTPVVPENPDPSLEEPEVTGPDDPEVTPDNPDPNDEGDPIEDAVKAALELERERLKEEYRHTWEEEQAMQAQLLAEQSRQRQQNDLYTDALKNAHTRIRNVRYFDEAGQEAEFTDDMFQRLVAEPFNDYNTKVRKHVQDETLTTVANIALELLPEENRDEFRKRAAGKPLKDYFEIFTDLRAPHTETWKEREKRLEVEKKAEHARGFARGQKAPSGTAPQGNERPTPTETYDTNTTSGLIAAHRAGLVDDTTFLAKWRELGK